MPNENSFDPDICGSKRPTYPEKDRFEELYSELRKYFKEILNVPDFQLVEMHDIYRALKKQLKTKQDHLFDEDYKSFKDLQEKAEKLEQELIRNNGTSIIKTTREWKTENNGLTLQIIKLQKETQELNIKLNAETTSNNRVLEIAQTKMEQL